MRHSKYVRMLVPLLILSLVLTACGGGTKTTTTAPQTTSPAPAPKEITVELIMDLSGPLGGVFSVEILAVKDYFKSVNNTVGGAKITLVEADSKSDPAIISTHYDQAVSRGAVLRLMGSTVEAQTVMAKMEKDKVPSFGTASASALFSQPSWHYSTLVDWAKSIVTAVDGYLYPEFQKKGLNRPMRLALVVWDNTLGRSGPLAVDGLMKLRPGRYEKVVETFSPATAIDFSGELNRVKAANPDAVLVFVSGGAAGLVMRDAGKVGLPTSIPLISDSTSIFSQGNVNLAGAQIAAALGVNLYPVQDDKYKTNELMDKLLKDNNRTWDIQYMLALVQMQIFKHITEKAVAAAGSGPVTGTLYKQALESMKNVDLGLGAAISYADYPGDREAQSNERVLKWDSAGNKAVVAKDWFPIFSFEEIYGKIDLSKAN